MAAAAAGHRIQFRAAASGAFNVFDLVYVMTQGGPVEATNVAMMDIYREAFQFSIYLLRAFFASIPRELIDAARIDGCTELSAFLRVVIPISRAGLATVALLTFVGAWNEFFLALLSIHNPDLLTLPLGLQTFFFQYHVQWPYYFAGLSTAIIPIVIVYLVFQRQFISAMTAGAVRR